MTSSAVLRMIVRNKCSIACFLILAAGLATYAQQGNGNPFVDHSDTGETVHILPAPAAVHSPRDTQPTFAGPHSGVSVNPASYGSGNVTYHGGKVMSGPNFYPIYWNSAVATSTQTSLGWSTIRQQMNAFAGAFLTGTAYSQADPTADYSIVGQYGDSSGNVALPGNGFLADLVDVKSTQSNIKDSAIRSYLTGLFNSGKVPVRANTIYGIYFPSGMKVILSGGASCTSFCGYHSHYSYNGTQIKYAVFPYPDCSGCKLASLAVADMLTIVSSHEIREAATDPGDFNSNAWYDSVGYEADDKCAWHNLYQLNRTPGLNFWVQPEYSNGGGIYPGPGCVNP